jgi:HlyD family secretion protein
MKKTLAIAIPIALLGLIAAIGRAKLGKLHRSEFGVPTTVVKRGDVSVKAYTSGALAAGRSALLLAPAVAGGNLRIVQLLSTGAHIGAGGVVVSFDPTEQEYNLEQARTDLQEAQQQIIKAKADAAVQEATDQTQLLSDRFDVRRAQLTVGTNALVSAIDAKKNLLTLDQAERALAQLQSDIKSHTVSDQATLAVNEQKRQKALLAMQLAQRNIQSMTVRSPLTGLVEVKKNEMAYGGIFIEGMPLPEFHVGDSTFPGMPVAQVIDPAEIDIEAKITQSDRANINVGDPAEITVDALPGRTFEGHVKTISSVASQGSFFVQSGTPPTFDLTIQLARTGPNLRPGYKAQIVISGHWLRNVLYLPPPGIFEQHGSPIVYVKMGKTFRVRPVKIAYRTETRAVVEGLSQGTVVALVNPQQRHGAPGSTAGVPGAEFPGGAP